MVNDMRASSGHLGRVTTSVLFLLLLAACAGNTPADESAPASEEASPTSTESAASPSEPSEPASDPPSATASAEQSEGASGLTIPREFPCDPIDETTVEELIGGEIGLTREWEPGDQPFGDLQPPSTNFGCQYVAEGGAEFGLTMVGDELTEDQWRERFTSDLECDGLEVPEAIIGEIVRAEVCTAQFPEGWSTVDVSGLFGGTGILCSTYVPDELIDETYPARLLAECGRILLELAS